MNRFVAVFALGLTLLPGGAAAKRKPSDLARGATAGEAERGRAGRSVSGPCRDELLTELSVGRRLSKRCDLERRRAGRAAVRASRAFGFVASREVDLRAVRLVVGRAVLCRRWPLREGDASVLRLEDVQAARCWSRRLRRPIPVGVVRADGTRVTRVLLLNPDADGRVALGYGALDLELRSRGFGTLADFARAEIGEGAWAGVVDLARLREFRAAWHLQWVAKGQGSQGLFDARYPELAGATAAADATAEAVESAPAAKSE